MSDSRARSILWAENIGRNGWDAFITIPLNQSAESRNVSLFDGGLGTKRGGSASLSTTGATMPWNALLEYVPGQDLTVAEIFGVDASATTKILRNTTGTWSNLTLKDNVATEPYSVYGVVLNKKLYLFYDSTVNRTHVFDPNVSTTDVRRAGLAPFAAAATVADTGGGAYPATLRYYKTRNVLQVSSVVNVRSEANASVSFTPSGAGTAARITRPTAVGEAETHWEVYGSTDNVTFYGPIATIAIGTTTYDDSSTPSTWATTYSAEPTIGTYTPFPSCKFPGTDGSRLYALGVWESTAGDSMTPKSGRFYFGPVQDSTATNDDERINNTTTLKGFIDLGRNSGAVDRGVTPKPINNVIYAFQSSGVYGLFPTDSDSTPYRRQCLDPSIGAVNQQSIVMARDRAGQTCAFFLDPSFGPFVIGGVDGLKWCGKDVSDVWALVNKDASTVQAWGVWYPDRFQVWFSVAVSGGNTPTLGIILDVTKMYIDPKTGDLRGGWTTYDGDLMNSRCACVFSNTLGITRSRYRVPHTGGNSKLLRYDENVHRDDTTSYQAYVQSPGLRVATTTCEVKRAYLAADVSTAVTIRQTLIKNATAESRASDVLLTASGSETIVLKKFEDAALQDAWTFQTQLGDANAVDSSWHLHQYWCEKDDGAPL